MSALFYLFLIKLKATIRNLFSRVSSVIMLILGLVFVIFTGSVMLNNRSAVSSMMNIQGLEAAMMLFCGYIIFMMSIMILQKRTAIITQTDALYIFAGPFKRTQILAYLLADTVKGSLLYALISVFYVLTMISGSIKLNFSIVFILAFCGLLMFYFIFALITYFYFLEMVHPHAKKIKIGILIAFLGLIGLIFLRNLSVSNLGLEGAINAFVSDPLFSWIPVFGWCKVALIAFVQQQMGTMILGLSATCLVCGILTWLILNVRGNFYEQAIQDAQWYSALRKEAKENGSITSQQKTKEINGYHFLSGAASIISKNFLQMRKTRQWITLQELIMIAIYLGISLMSKQSFMFYQYFILIVIFMSASTDHVIKDLKIFYVYLIPEKPMKKMLALLVPSLFKLVLVTLVSILPCLFLFNVDLITLFNALIINISYGVLFLSACLVSLRILKSRTTVMLEQFIKMGISLVFAIPSILVMVLMMVSGNSLLAQLSVVGGFFVNILCAYILIWISSGLFKGTNIMAD